MSDWLHALRIVSEAEPDVVFPDVVQREAPLLLAWGFVKEAETCDGKYLMLTVRGNTVLCVNEGVV